MQTEKSNSSDRELKVSTILNAPIERVWEVWTNPEHIKEWWGPNGFTNTIHQMQMIEGSEWLLTMHGSDGKDYPNKSVFTEIVKHNKIKFRHFNPNFTTTIEFEKQGDKTFLQCTCCSTLLMNLKP